MIMGYEAHILTVYCCSAERHARTGRRHHRLAHPGEKGMACRAVHILCVFIPIRSGVALRRVMRIEVPD